MSIAAEQLDMAIAKALDVAGSAGLRHYEVAGILRLHLIAAEQSWLEAAYQARAAALMKEAKSKPKRATRIAPTSSRK